MLTETVVMGNKSDHKHRLNYKEKLKKHDEHHY